MELQQNGEKLIRHLIPVEPTRKVTGEEHVQFLKWKIAEEAGEVATATSETFASELADVRQVLGDFCRVVGIKFSELREPETVRVPRIQTERVRFFRAQIHLLVELANAIPDKTVDRIAHVSDMLDAVAAISQVAGIRDIVRTEMAKRLTERGDFVHGVVWEKPLTSS